VTTSYDTVIRAFGNNAGIEVPAEVLAELGAGKRPKVLVQVGNYKFATTVGAMGGLALISLSKAHREASGLRAGQSVHVDLELDAAPSEIAIPQELASALAEAGLIDAFDINRICRGPRVACGSPGSASPRRWLHGLR